MSEPVSPSSLSNSRALSRPARRWRLEFPPELPVSGRHEEIAAAIRAHPVLIVAGDTGSGKTTQLPKICLAAGRERIACTQPRRVAAISLSRRVATELDVPWGREVGCKIRFMDKSGPDTAVKFVTDGMLLAEVQSDPMLRTYDTIIIDEAHERSLNIDFLLGRLNQLRHRRRDLKIVITSATIDTAAFGKAFDAPVIQVSGRTFPVEVIYSPVDELLEESGDFTHLDAVAVTVERILLESDHGDILVFLATERDIRETADLLASRKLGPLEILPLFGRLSAGDQQRVFAPARHRKIVLSTNIAETSLTIPGIRFVVDTGEARLSRFNNRTRTRRLPIEPISQSSADQRKGRCGRVAEGVCIRLYSEDDFNRRPEFTPPEIQRANLADVILRMKSARLGEIERFPFIDPPPHAAVRAGYILLEELGAIDKTPARALT
ncbi:MAG: helicase-related protein, partial [Opitutaceae bacterium]